MADNDKGKSEQGNVSEFVEIHQEVAEEAINSGFGIFSTPGKSEDSDDKEDE